ncbi:MAG: regulatory protein RecX [bacterium]|nr:regulatory protein RecX [bacterium]
MAEPAQTRLWNLVLRYLGYRARSEKEVRDYLRQKLFKEDFGEEKKELLITEIISKLYALNFLDDRTLAERVVSEGRRQYKGKRRILLDLKKKGLATAVISSSSNPSSPSEEELASAAAAKRARFYQNLDSQTFRRRLAGYLARRGFEWEVVKSVVSSAEALRTDRSELRP